MKAAVLNKESGTLSCRPPKPTLNCRPSVRPLKPTIGWFFSFLMPCSQTFQSHQLTCIAPCPRVWHARCPGTSSASRARQSHCPRGAGNLLEAGIRPCQMVSALSRCLSRIVPALQWAVQLCSCEGRTQADVRQVCSESEQRGASQCCTSLAASTVLASPDASVRGPAVWSDRSLAAPVDLSVAEAGCNPG